jgi:hypothetical protein
MRGHQVLTRVVRRHQHHLLLLPAMPLRQQQRGLRVLQHALLLLVRLLVGQECSQGTYVCLACTSRPCKQTPVATHLLLRTSTAGHRQQCSRHHVLRGVAHGGHPCRRQQLQLRRRGATPILLLLLALLRLLRRLLLARRGALLLLLGQLVVPLGGPVLLLHLEHAGLHGPPALKARAQLQHGLCVSGGGWARRQQQQRSEEGREKRGVWRY